MDLVLGTRSSTATLCMPYAMLAPALEELGRPRTAASVPGPARTRRAHERRLSDVEVDVSVRFDPTRMASSTIGRLSVGDVVSLGHRTTSPLSVTSASTTFARAVPGSSGRKLAVLIVPRARPAPIEDAMTFSPSPLMPG
jgi:flagellar motor switch protein FliM